MSRGWRMRELLAAPRAGISAAPGGGDAAAVATVGAGDLPPWRVAVPISPCGGLHGGSLTQAEAHVIPSCCGTHPNRYRNRFRPQGLPSSRRESVTPADDSGGIPVPTPARPRG